MFLDEDEDPPYRLEHVGELLWWQMMMDQADVDLPRPVGLIPRSGVSSN
jgi:hypothetical protein